MGFFSTATRRAGIAGELLSFFARNKRWWLLRRSFTPSSRRNNTRWPILLRTT